MLKPAILYKEELIKKYQNTWFDEDYKYYHSSYERTPNIEADTWNYIQFVSVNDSNEVIGYLRANIARTNMSISSLGIINFSDDILTFGRDLHEFLEFLLDVKKFNKINFNVVVGNPIEKSYDLLIKKYNGRVVGFYEKDYLINNEFHDSKIYEITRENYLESKKNKK